MEFLKLVFEHPGVSFLLLIGLAWVIESIGTAINKSRFKDVDSEDGE